MPPLVEALDAAAAALSALPSSVADVAGVSDAELMAAQSRLARLTERLQASSALTAAEIARRSRADLGYAGLAQQIGARTPERLVQQLTGVSRREASTLVRVGALLHDSEQAGTGRGADAGGHADAVGSTAESSVDDGPITRWTASGSPWLAPIASAVAAGELSVGAADAIRSGLGSTNADVTVELLRQAAESLLESASGLDVDELNRRARALRDDIDYEGLVERQRERYEARTATVRRTPDGMVRLHALFAPEAGGELLVATFDAITSPRRGGPRFVDPRERESASQQLEDSRSTEQLFADALVELIRLGVNADSGAIAGSKKPAVRVLVTKHALDRGTGIGRIEGSPAPVPIGAVRAEVCASGTVPIEFDDSGQVLNLGRERRLFSTQQRIALAARDGGCRFGDCDRPPSWCEAHHIDEWDRDVGRTDVADGVLLCRHHHLLVHNNGWRIVREGGSYFAIPPRALDPRQQRVELPTKSAALRELQRERLEA